MSLQTVTEAKGILDALKIPFLFLWRFFKTLGKTRLNLQDQTLTYQTDHILCERQYKIYRPKRSSKVVNCKEVVNLIGDREIIRAEIQLPKNIQPLSLPIKGVRLKVTNRLSYLLSGCNIPIPFYTNKPIQAIRLLRKSMEDRNFSIEVTYTSRETCDSRAFKKRFPRGVHSNLAECSDILQGLVGISVLLITDLDKKETVEIELEHVLRQEEKT
jgi:hypothetical protein